VILGLLAVVRPRQVAPVLFGQRDGGGRGQRDALVGRAEQHVDLDPGIDERGGVGAAQSCQCGARIDPAHVEEVRTQPAGLERELAEAQHLPAQGQFDEVALVVVHGRLAGMAAVRAWYTRWCRRPGLL